MAVARLRYFQLAAVVSFFGLAFIAYIHVTHSIDDCAPGGSAAETALRGLDCNVNSILCGVNGFKEYHDAPDLNKLRNEFHKLVTTIDHPCPTLHRFGRAGDGGYAACMTKDIRPNNNSCLVYSFGVSNDWSFDEAWAKYGCEVHSFDPSLGLTDHVHAPNMTFHNLGLWGTDYINRKGWKLERLSTIKNRLQHKERIIDALKIDVEGGEWPFLRDVIFADLNALSNVRQLYIELHAPRLRSCSNMKAADFEEINDYMMRLRSDLNFKLYQNVQHNNCCGRYSDLMPQGVPEKCCHEVFFLNARLLAT